MPRPAGLENVYKVSPVNHVTTCLRSRHDAVAEDSGKSEDQTDVEWLMWPPLFQSWFSGWYLPFLCFKLPQYFVSHFAVLSITLHVTPIQIQSLYP